MRDDLVTLAAQIGRLAAQIETLRRAVIAMDPVPVSPETIDGLVFALHDADPDLPLAVARALATRAAGREYAT
jgi:hypothetical protein